MLIITKSLARDSVTNINLIFFVTPIHVASKGTPYRCFDYVKRRFPPMTMRQNSTNISNLRGVI